MLEHYFDTYKEELELIDAQNRVELDLYSLVAYVVRSAESGRSISLRDVSSRRTSSFSRAFKENSGFPDFVVRERKKSSDAQNLGTIEVKCISENLDDEDKIEQLQGHIESYKKVLYTNGLEWRFYDHSFRQKWPSVILGKYGSSGFSWEQETAWKNLLQRLNDISWI